MKKSEKIQLKGIDQEFFWKKAPKEGSFKHDV